MIGYITGESLIKLLNIGAEHCLYSTSTTYEHLGDITAVYFFNAEWKEVAHQTMLDSKSTFTEYSRSWGGGFNGHRDGYRSPHRFKALQQMHDNGDIKSFGAYRLV